jgi:hypothetical protein
MIQALSRQLATRLMGITCPYGNANQSCEIHITASWTFGVLCSQSSLFKTHFDDAI